MLKNTNAVYFENQKQRYVLFINCVLYLAYYGIDYFVLTDERCVKFYSLQYDVAELDVFCSKENCHCVEGNLVRFLTDILFISAPLMHLNSKLNNRMRCI